MFQAQRLHVEASGADDWRRGPFFGLVQLLDLLYPFHVFNFIAFGNEVD